VAARYLLPPTQAVYGRPSKRRSHYLFICTENTEPKAVIKLTDEEKKTICELRLGSGSKGAQSVAPGSTHESGELYEWDDDGDPGTETCKVLKRAIELIAVAVLIGRQWPAKNRHDAALLIGGFLDRCHMSEEHISDVVVAAQHVAGVDNQEHIENGRLAAISSIAARAEGRNTYGYPEMVEWFGEPTTKRIAKIIGYREMPANKGFALSNTGTPIPNNQHNIRHALHLLEIELRYDVFHDRLLVSGLPGHTLLDDPTLDKIWLTIDERFKFRAQIEFFRTVVNNAARRNSFHPLRDYLNGLKWDGVKRLDRWLTTYAGAQDTEFMRAVGAITLIAAVRRIRTPGCKFDEMLILESTQGKEKSEMLKALAVQEDWFSDDVPLNADGKRVIEQLMGKWIVEAADLSGMRKADVEHLKAMLSRQVDRARLAYGRQTSEQPRSSIIVGTTNSPKYLKDLTGNRRFWPIKVGTIKLEKLKSDRDQLWAEAVSREAAGASIRLDSSLWGAAAVEQSERTVQDPWHELLTDVLGDLQGKLAAADVWRIVGVDPGHRLQEHNVRLGQAMKELGFEPKSLNIDNKKQRAYARGAKEEKELQHIFVVIGEDGAFAGHTMEEVNAKKTAAREGKHI
jgi:hypothetical protein